VDEVIEIALADTPPVVGAHLRHVGVEGRFGDAARLERGPDRRDIAPGDPDGRRWGLG
jgi:hypothetical protein